MSEADTTKGERMDGTAYPALTETKYGFDYGTARVERVYSDDRYGVVLRVASMTHPERFVDVRVSPAGLKVEAMPS